MTPKIDYSLLSAVLDDYQADYTYVEVPWAVAEHQIAVTLPDTGSAFALGVRAQANLLFDASDCNYLLGSAEQALLGMNLTPGRYCAVSPCFRNEPVLNLLYQQGFMKIELFVNEDPGEDALERVINTALGVLSGYTQHNINRVQTEEGFDLTLGGIEIGSYGIRETSDFGNWIYGTGLALPRFSVADALAGVC